MTEPRIPSAAFGSGKGDPVPRHRRKPRQANDRDGREIRPIDLANAMKHGVRSIRATCPPPCRHEGDLPIDRFPPATFVPDVGLRIRCTVCGRKRPVTEPVWQRRDKA
ncbi:hypothetical protein QO012_004430 [Methylobacterium aerolatum]|uniref:Uncharacterized protein n=1 Tax=Methylobacterium aerolatum TaxID=418708 RepID=A0ABU0I897_9HYPH|nr:hypothetical protein [Methylobacterium aerolatum]GJD37533.1 hypothetical protein FMGBMHLM_4465 [Methylobacterium aerolatum]